MNTTQSPSEVFGLIQDNFILDPVSDYGCFARDDINTQSIAESIEIDLVTGLAPKRFFYGPYGAGKTHTLMRTMKELNQLTPIYYVRIECPVLARKSRFHDLYREGILRGLGQDFVLGLMEKVVEDVGFIRSPEALHEQLKNWFQDEEIAQAAERIYVPHYERLKLWRWISGVATSRSDLDELHQTQDLTQAEAARLADIVVTFGRLLKKLENKTLVLILDEMERLGAIDSDTITTFISGFTRLVDPNQKWVSVLIGSSAAVETELVDIFSGNSPVMSRLGAEAKVEIPSLESPDVDRFIAGIIKFVRDQNFDIHQMVASVCAGADEKITEEFYPFSIEAIEALKSKTPILTPREITMQMTRSLGRAYRRNQKYISSANV